MSQVDAGRESVSAAAAGAIEPPPGFPPLPEPLPLPVTDSHCHLDAQRAGHAMLPPATALALAAQVNVTRVVQIGCELPSARWTVSNLGGLPGVVGGVALHPTEAAEAAAAGVLPAHLDEVRALAAADGIRAVGETGLDYHWTAPPLRPAQIQSFVAHIDLARELDRTLVIHDRDAHADILRVLEEHGAPPRVVFHCFSGDADMARHCVERGWFLSFAGPLTFRNARALREAFLVTPPDLVLVETDAPYLTPHPHRGATNASYLVPHTVRAMAALRGVGLEEQCRALQVATAAAFGEW